MFFELFFALRYLKAKRKQAFIPVITVISVLSVMVGVMSLVVVLSVMNGFRDDLMSKILGVNSHVLIMNYGGAFKDYEEVGKSVEEVDGVLAWTPFIYSQGMINSSGNVSMAVIRGLDPRSVVNVLDIESMIKMGSLASIQGSADGLPGIIIGNELSRKVEAHPGDTLTVVSPEGKSTPSGRAPKTRKYKVTAIFDSGMYDYDASMAFISLKESQDFLGLGDRVTGLEIKVRDVYKADTVAQAIQEKLGYPYWTRDWKLTNRNLFAMLSLQKTTLFVILSMIVLVGALSIIGTLVMVVMEKKKDIAILRAMGTSARSIMSIFMLQGVFVGIVGTLSGLVSGLGICFILAKYKFITLPADVYYISALSVQVEFSDVFFVALSAVIICFFATLYPSWRASKLNPVDAIRYE
ncbi:MAG: lipoprotein-releasing ABC transporter permease subunit [Pseudomonadota bacterium]